MSEGKQPCQLPEAQLILNAKSPEFLYSGLFNALLLFLEICRFTIKIKLFDPDISIEHIMSFRLQL
ncbi:hypothetical protein C8N25_1314 [Algoriphagus antarcticus]|uniref:Uncharacterized protein n=1 Tax=Algoriphagus antarcticus TaxID=238540 RepID=A0A3E0D9V4_9BACT|nr:hypothetical protein C8N25_1314 [Algoriphagus antarcticus]